MLAKRIAARIFELLGVAAVSYHLCPVEVRLEELFSQPARVVWGNNCLVSLSSTGPAEFKI